jgi:hypothetical protein
LPSLVVATPPRVAVARKSAPSAVAVSHFMKSLHARVATLALPPAPRAAGSSETAFS